MSKLANQFNETLINNVDGLPSNNGGLLFAININQPKFLTGITASIVSTNPFTVNDEVLQRLVVCTGYLQATEQIFYGPLPKQLVYPAGSGRILLDVTFRNTINIDFANPLFCNADEVLNICTGIGWIAGEVGAGITPCIGMLTVNGYTGQQNSDAKFPYVLR